jgi:hypothetical protein
MDFRATTMKVEHIVRLDESNNDTFDSERLQYVLYKAIKEIDKGPLIVDYGNIIMQTKSKGNKVAFKLQAPAMVLVNPEDIEGDEDDEI